jgi:hypothetical protein
LHYVSANGVEDDRQITPDNIVAITELLLQRGADTGSADNEGARPLHFSAQEGHVAVVELLLSRGVSTDVLNSFGGTALDTARWSAEHEPKPDHGRIIAALSVPRR